MVWLMSIKNSTKPEKKMTAVFCKCKVKDDCKGSNHRTIHFGQKGSSTYLDHKDEAKKDAYLKRHKVNERWDEPQTAGSLAKNILWNKKTLSASIADFKKRFNL